MKKRLAFVLIVTTVLALAVTLPASATKPAEIHVEVKFSLLGYPSPFTVSGPTVDDFSICQAGTVVNASGKRTGDSPTGLNWQGIKHFTCGDGSGEFFLNMQARIDYRKGSTFNWNVLRGTGDYADLHGAGKGVALWTCEPDCVYQVFDGRFHIDP